MEKLVVVSKVYDGKLSGYASETLREFISSNNGKNLEIVVKRKRAKRSNAQNKFYWGAVIPIIQAPSSIKEGQKVEFQSVDEFSHPRLFANVGLFEGLESALIQDHGDND